MIQKLVHKKGLRIAIIHNLSGPCAVINNLIRQYGYHFNSAQAALRFLTNGNHLKTRIQKEYNTKMNQRISQVVMVATQKQTQIENRIKLEHDSKKRKRIWWTLLQNFRIQLIEWYLKWKTRYTQWRYHRQKRFKIQMINRVLIILNQHKAFILGAKGEETVIDHLKHLPDSFHVLNNITISLGKSYYVKHLGQYVKSAQIDHLVIGPSGIFIIETKNFSRRTFFHEIHGEFPPNVQLERASFVIFIHLKRKIRFLVKTRNILTFRHIYADLHYEFITVLPFEEVVNYIMMFKTGRRLLNRQIEVLVKEFSRYLN